jgi:hypothetical protein
MSLLQLFTGGRVHIISQASVLEIDATPSITHERNAALAKSPLENGVTVADHVTLENEKVRLNCVVTKNPVSFLSTVFSLSSVVQGLQTQIDSSESALSKADAVGGLLLNADDRVSNSFLFLTQLWQNRIPFTVTAGLETYHNVIMTSLSIVQNSKTKNASKFTAGFEKINFASTETAELSEAQFDKAIGKSAAKTVKRGKQIAPEVSESVKSKASSVLFKLGKLSGALQ